MKLNNVICKSFLLAVLVATVAPWQTFSNVQAQVAKTPRLVSGDRFTLGTESNRSASIRLGDVDGDGDLDAVVANGRHWPEQNYLFLNQGRARFSVMRPIGKDRSTTYACELADLDGDGDLDIAMGNDMALGSILLNDGKGEFAFHCSFGEVTSLRSLTTADIDNDGDIDILTTCRGSQNRIYINDGTARFESSIDYGTQDDATINVAVADVNSDGQMDLLLANRGRQSSRWLLGTPNENGQAKFADTQPFGDASAQTRAVAVGDLNGDGHLDWVAGNIRQANVVYLSDGTGAATKTVEFGADDSQTYSIALADLDNDGDLDIVTGNVAQANSFFVNEGDGLRFRQERFGDDQNATYGLSVGDLNNNGRTDVAVANSGAANFLFLNLQARGRGRVESEQQSRGSNGNNVELSSPESTRSSNSSNAELNVVQDDQDQEQEFRNLPVYQSKNWPAFRGTGARGVAEGFPLRTEWNADPESGEMAGVLWEADVPGLGHSSPVVFGDKVFVITAVAEAGDAPLKVEAGGAPTAADDNGQQEWLVLCYDRNNGEELWRRAARKGKPGATRHAKATHANTSVCVDGKHVVAFLGSEGIHCFDMDGDLIWSRDLGVINISKYDVGWGFASSPALHNDRIVILCDDPSDPYVAALSLKDGHELWKMERKEICERSWGTPLIHEQGETTQVVVNGWPWIVSYDLADGQELWRIEGGGDNPIPTPFEAHGSFYITNAHGGPSPIYAVNPEARGVIKVGDDAQADADGENPLVWSVPRGGSYMSTPVVYENYIYLGNSNGVVRCFHALTGEKVFEKRLGRKAGVIASLVAGDGKIFLASENGTVYVLAAGPEYNLLASNSMSEPCFATPAISQGVLFIRTTKRLIALK